MRCMCDQGNINIGDVGRIRRLHRGVNCPCGLHRGGPTASEVLID
jgi:hypothetical protein